jgi:hypothetical protein
MNHTLLVKIHQSIQTLVGVGLAEGLGKASIISNLHQSRREGHSEMYQEETQSYRERRRKNKEEKRATQDAKKQQQKTNETTHQNTTITQITTRPHTI